MRRFRFLVFFLLVGGVFFFVELGEKNLRSGQEWLLSFLSPLVHSGATVKKNIGGLGQQLMTLNQLDIEYQRLLLENQQLRAENHLLHGLEEENKRLRNASGYCERSTFALLPAVVISRDSSVWWNTLKINRGTKDGVELDRAVITDAGLVGKTIAVADHLAVVLLITDENCKVACKVEGTREQGIAAGMRAATGELQLSFLNKLADLQPGQKVYTAGVSGGIFPSGISVGTVKSFQAHELDGQAIIEPSVDLSTLENVFVIVGAK